MKICPKCEITHSKPGKFCSRTCANSRSFTEESRLKKSRSAKDHYKKHGYTSTGSKGIPQTQESIKKMIETRRLNALEKFSKGTIKWSGTLKKVMIELRGEQCESCGTIEWLGQKLSLQVHHKDGNAGNNLPDNLSLLCPNCHSLTETFGARNRGRGRKSRGIYTNK